MTYFLLAQEGRHFRSVMSSENLAEVLEFAKEAKVTGIVVEEHISVDYSGEPKMNLFNSVQGAFKNLIEKIDAVATERDNS